MAIKAKLMRSMFKMMGLPTCEEVDQFTYDYLDGNLDAATTKAIEKHLRLCKNCQKFIASYRLVKEQAPREPAPSIDPEMKEHMFEFLKKNSKSF